MNINVGTFFSVIWRFLTKRVTSAVWIVFLLVLILLIALYAYMNTGAYRYDRIRIHNEYSNLNIHSVDIDLNFASLARNKEDEIIVNVKLTSHITDSLYANYGRYVFVADNKGYNLKKLQIWDPEREHILFQNRVRSSIISNKDFKFDVKLQTPEPFPTDAESIDYDGRGVIFNFKNGYKSTYIFFFNGDTLLTNRIDVDTLPPLSAKKEREESLFFNSGNLYSHSVSLVDNKNELTSDYYLKYNANSPKLLYHRISVLGKLFNVNMQGNVNSYILFNFLSENKIEDVLKDDQFKISFKTNYIVMNDIDVYPAPDVKSHSGFIYTSPDKIRTVLNDGIILKGELLPKKARFSNMNFWITLFIGSISTFLMTMLINRWQYWERKKKMEREKRRKKQNEENL